MAQPNGIDLYPLIVSYIRNVRIDANSKIYIYEAVDSGLSNYEQFCDDMGLGCIAPTEVMGKALVQLALVEHCEYILEDCSWVYENLNESDPKSISELIDMFIVANGAAIKSMNLIKIVCETEKIALVHDKSPNKHHICPNTGYKRAMLYRTPSDIADIMQQVIDENDYTLFVDQRFILSANDVG
jgi:hypothetical protein